MERSQGGWTCGLELGRESGCKLTNFRGLFPKVRVEAVGPPGISKGGRVEREEP